MDNNNHLSLSERTNASSNNLGLGEILYMLAVPISGDKRIHELFEEERKSGIKHYRALEPAVYAYKYASLLILGTLIVGAIDYFL